MHSIFNKNKIILIHFIIISLLTTGCSFPAKDTKITKTVYALDTVITLTFYEPVEEALLAEASEKIAEYENRFSATIPDSEISMINNAGGEWVTVSDDTLTLLQEAVRYCKLSDGKLDITISPVKNLWDFTGASDHIPSETDLAKALRHVDYTVLEISGNKVRLTDPNAALDLGCIAKGFIADEIRSFFLENGVTDGLLNFGGNVVTFGSKPDGSPYTIGIQSPFDKSGTPIHSVNASDNGYTSVVTSGIYERYFEKDDVIYHHILDPKTGYPTTNDLYSVTILSDSSTQGDALSTLCLMLGLKDGMKLIEETENVDAVFVNSDYEVFTTY